MSKKQKMAEFANDTYRISVTGRNVQVTESMKDYSIDKVSKIERFTDKILDVHVIMDIQKLDHRCDIVLRVNNIKIQAQAVSTDMYVSIDEAVKKLEVQLKKYLDKLHDHFSNAREEQKMRIDVITRLNEEDEVFSINQKLEDEKDHHLKNVYQPHKVVKQKSKPLKTLTFDEAVTKMDLSLDNFLIFRNERTKRLQVIYRRLDDNYGVMTVEE